MCLLQSNMKKNFGYMNRLNKILAALLARLNGGNDNYPIAVNDSFTVAEDTTLTGNLATNDTLSADGGNVFSLGTPPVNGNAVINANGTFTYTPNPNYNGSDSFTYALTDSDGDISIATVSLTVTSVDDLPVAVNDSFTVNQDTNLTGNLATNDTLSQDGGNSFSKVSGPSHGTATVNANGTFTYQPTAGYSGTDSFVYRITDADGDQSTATVTITINELVVNPPTLADLEPYRQSSTSWVGIPYGDAEWTEDFQDFTQLFDVDLPSTPPPVNGYPVVTWWHANGQTRNIAPGGDINTLKQDLLAAGFVFMSFDFRHPAVNVAYGAPHNDVGYATQMARALSEALNLDQNHFYGVSRSRGSLCIWQNLQPDLASPTASTWQGRQSSWLRGIWAYNGQTTYSTTEFANLFIKANQRAGFLALNPDDPRWGSALQSVATAPHIPYIRILHEKAYPTGLVNAADADVHFPGFGSALIDRYVTNGYADFISGDDLIPSDQGYNGAVAWFLGLYETPSSTVDDLGMLGGQPGRMSDFINDPLTNDLMKRARTMAPVNNPGAYYEKPFPLDVVQLVRGSGIVTVTLNSTQDLVDFPLYTGQYLVLTCLSSSGFDVDHVKITRLTNTTFTYPRTGTNKTFVADSPYDCEAYLMPYVDIDTVSGHPKADFRALLIRSSGSADTFPDLAGTYTGVFPGTVPTSVQTVPGGALTWTPGSSTFTISVPSASSGALDLICTGVPTDGTFRLPKIRRTTDPQDDRFLRPDALQHYSRFSVIRFMDLGATNANGFVTGQYTRPRIQAGTGLPVEDMIKMCNELNADMWYCIPMLANNGYVDAIAAIIRDQLNSNLKCYFEFSNEVWNEQGPFRQTKTNFMRMRNHLSAFMKGYYGFNQITSVVRSSNVVTVTLTQPVPYTIGQNIAVKLVGDTSANTNSVAVASVTGNTFTYANTGADATLSFSQGAIYGNLSSNILANQTDWDPYEFARRFFGYETYRIGQRIKTVFGENPNRACITLMWQMDMYQGSWDPVTTLMSWLELQYGPPSDWLYAIGGAPYAYAENWSTAPGANNNEKIGNAMMTVLDGLKSKMRYLKYLATKYGLKAFNYEGGPDTVPVGNTAAVDAFWDADQMRVVQEAVLNYTYSYGCDLHMQYNSSNRWDGYTGSTSWGIGSSMTDILPVGNATAPKAKALDNVLSAPPASPDTALLLPGNIVYQNGGTVKADSYPNTGAVNGMRQLYNSTTAHLENLVYVPEERIYYFTIWGKIQIGGGANGARVFVDGQSVGTLNLYSDGTAISTGTAGGYASPSSLAVTLSKGFHVVKVMSPTSTPDGFAVSKIVVL